MKGLLPKMSSSPFEPAGRAGMERLAYSVQFASLAIIYYDYILTLPDEIKYVWRGGWRISTLFYIFCRYALVANFVYLLAIAKHMEIVNCDTGYMISGVLSLLGHAGVIAVWGLRTYAICDKNKYVAGVLGLSGGATIVLLIVRAPFNRCTGPVHLHGVRGAISASMIFFDVTAFLLATHRAWMTMRENRKTQIKIKSSANDVIFAQGLLYMAPVFVLSVCSLAMNFPIRLEFTRLLNGLKLPLSGLLTARFLLCLRKWNDEQTRANDACLSLPRFATSGGSGEGNVSASLPQFVSTRSTGSVLDELSGDIGPREGSSGSDNIDDSSMDSVDLPEMSMRSSSIIRKGKRRDDSMNEDEDYQPRVLSATESERRAGFVDPEVGFPSAGPSYMRGRTRIPASIDV